MCLTIPYLDEIHSMGEKMAWELIIESRWPMCKWLHMGHLDSIRFWPYKFSLHPPLLFISSLTWPSSLRTDAGDFPAQDSRLTFCRPRHVSDRRRLQRTTARHNCLYRTASCRGLLHSRHDTFAVTLPCGLDHKAPIAGHRRRQASSGTGKGQGRKVPMPQMRHHTIFSILFILSVYY